MRPSSYLFFANATQGRTTILFQGMLGILDRVESELADFLSATPFDLNSASAKGISETRIEWLAQRGYLTNHSPEDEHEAFTRYVGRLHRRDIDETCPAFSLIPTYGCNLRCHYCFQSHQLHEDMRLMSVEMIDRAFEAICHHLSTGMAVPRSPAESFIKLYGGEPLLKQNVEAIFHIVRKSQEAGFYLKAVTNGTDLDHYVDVLGPTGIRHLQITVDGIESVHDQRRIGPTLPKTFKNIMANVELALDRGTKIELRSNSDRTNLELVPLLYEELERRGWIGRPGFMFEPANITPSSHYKAPTLITTGGFFKILQSQEAGSQSCCDANSQINAAVKSFAQTGRVTPSTAFCSAQTGYYILDLFGDVYTCENEVGIRDKRIGSFASGILEIEEAAQNVWLNRSVANISQCSWCPVALLCGGGCGFNAALASGSYYSPYCDGFKSRTAEALPLAFDRYVAQCSVN